jgi:hypothetical protein
MSIYHSLRPEQFLAISSVVFQISSAIAPLFATQTMASWQRVEEWRITFSARHGLEWYRPGGKTEIQTSFTTFRSKNGSEAYSSLLCFGKKSPRLDTTSESYVSGQGETRNGGLT